MRSIPRALGVAICAACLGACGSEQALTFTGAEPPEPASVRLFINGGDVTDHLPLNSGFTQEVEVRLYAANGVRIQGYDDHFELGVAFTPSPLVAASPVDGRALVKAMTPIAAPDTPGEAIVTVTHAHTAIARTFGPFEVLVH